MKREFSAGGVVFNSQGQVLLIKNMAMRDPNQSYWGFPKGHLEEGEGSERAVVREIQEETGLETEVIKKLGSSQYAFVRNGEKVFKSVAVFLMGYLRGELRPRFEEIQEAVWVDPQEAKTLLEFKKDREFLSQALELRNGE